MALSVTHATRLTWERVETLVFAGGGNRCFWQGGLITELQSRGWSMPRLLVGTSGGAAVAAAILTHTLEAALAECRRLYAQNTRLFDWRRLARLEIAFAQQRIYPQWLQSIIHADSWQRLRQSASDLQVAVTHPAPWLGLHGSVWAGTVAYLLDKKLLHAIHPRLPRSLGLKQAFYSLKACAQEWQARDLLAAAGAAPPVMKARRLFGRWALDGGYVDNAPLPPQTEAQKASTLVLLTRFYPKLPTVFQWQGRTYWQPSRQVPVSTWDCRPQTTVAQAFELGQRDAQRVAAARG
jgi:predicted acylesterase/phospholipase RssA